MNAKAIGGARKSNKNDTLTKMKRYKFLYLLLAPAILYEIIFNYIPIGGIVIAFQDYDIIGGILHSPFVGFSNFVKVFSNPKMFVAIKNTLIYSGMQLFLGTPFPIMLALLLNEINSKSFKKVTQTISYLPHFLSWVSVVGILSTFFETYGTYNDILVKIFGAAFERKNILMDSKYFVHIIFWSNIWKGIGWSSIIYLSAISGIDQSMYEAAAIDGCSRFKRAIYITIPSIAPTILILFIMSMGNLVTSNFEQVYGFQNLYTQEATETINTLVFRMGIQGGEYSLSTAFSLAQRGVSFLIVFLSNRIVKKLSGTGIW